MLPVSVEPAMREIDGPLLSQNMLLLLPISSVQTVRGMDGVLKLDSLCHADEGEVTLCCINQREGWAKNTVELGRGWYAFKM